jgi:cell division protein FtsW (lipid II flippase)
LLLVVVDAPARMPLMNIAALAIALTVLMCARMFPPAALDRLSGPALIAAAMAIPATAVFGASADGVARWMIVGGITIQPSMIVVPLMVLALAEQSDLARNAAVLITAIGLVLQPDPAAAAMLTAGVGAQLFGRAAGARSIAMFSGCVAAYLLALTHSVPLPPAPFVETMLSDALRIGGLASFVMFAGLGLMFAPAVVSRASPQRRFAFVAVWSTALLSSLMGAYPTPVLGFGGSAILGFMLSSACLRARPIGTRTKAGAGDLPQGKGPPALRFA